MIPRTPHRGRRRLGATWAWMLAVAWHLCPAPAGAQDAPARPESERVLAQALAGLQLERYERLALTIYREGDDDGLSRALELWISPSPDGTRIFGNVVGAAIRRGTSFLILPSALAADGSVASNQYFAYLPETGRVRRLSGSQRADAFFGSHLSLADFEQHPADHFRTVRMREDVLDPGSASEERVLRVVAALRLDAGYARAEFWIAEADQVLLRTVQYESDSSEPIRTIETRRAWLDAFESSLLPRKRVVRTRARGRTELIVVERSTTLDIPDSTFTLSHMRRKAH